MKLLSILCFSLFVFTASNAATPPPGKGTLYLESYIVGGLRISWLWLGDDGTFVRDAKFGVDPVNLSLEKEHNANNAGTYTTNGNTISVTFYNGKKENWPMEYNNGKLNTIDGWFAAAQTGLPSNYKLNGKFSASFYTANISKQQTYTFNNDGTLTISGVATVRTGATGATANASQKGTYSIKGNTLTIKMENGEQTLAVIGVLPGSKPTLIINDAMFK